MEESKYQPPQAAGHTSTNLLLQAKANVPGAWDRLLDIYGPIVAWWIRSKGITGANLRDVFQNVFATLHVDLVDFDKNDHPGGFRAWLKQRTLWKVTDFFRDNDQHDTLSESALPDPGDAERDPSIISAVVQRVLALLEDEFEPKTMWAFRRTAIDEQPAPEVAQELDMSPAAVRKARSRVQKRLREELENLDLVFE